MPESIKEKYKQAAIARLTKMLNKALNETGAIAYDHLPEVKGFLTAAAQSLAVARLKLINSK